MTQIRADYFGISAADVPTAINEHAEVVHERTRDWAIHYGLINGRVAQKLFDQLGYPALLARGCTAASADRLSLFAQWFTYLFFLDDQQDLAILTDRHPQFITLQEQLSHVLLARGQYDSSRATGLVAAVTDLSRRTTPLVSDAWWWRFVTHAEYVFAAQRQESDYRLTGQFPSLGEFKEVRRRAGAADMVFDIIEAADSAEIPTPVRYHTAIRQYADDLNNYTVWSNDVLGLDHDEANNDPNNYVMVRQRADGISRHEAIEAVTTEIIQLAHGLPARETDAHALIRTYSPPRRDRIERALHGWYAWALNVAPHYLRANSRLVHMDEASPNRPAAFTEDLLP